MWYGNMLGIVYCTVIELVSGRVGGVGVGSAQCCW